MAFQGHPSMGGAPAPGRMPPSGGMYHPPSYPPHPMMMGMPPMGQHMAPGLMPHPMSHPGMPPPMMMVPQVPIMSEPMVKVPIPSSTANMKVATTVFVGNISEKASDTLIRQILLRCGAIEGWKRVQDATGKLQGFGFCEYADPESTLRALRLLDKLKLGEKALVAKVDAKTRKDLLKYLITIKHQKANKSVNESEVEKEVNKFEEDKDVATAALISEVTDEAKSEDGRVKDSISTLLKDYLSVLSSTKSNEDIQRERDVKESILFMAKQSGNIDPDSTLEDMDMEDDIKTLVSDEIKRFRESYKRSDEARKEKKVHPDEMRFKGKEGGDQSPRERLKRDRSRSRSPAAKRESSPPPRAKSPVRSRSQERQEKEKRREAMRQREKEEIMKEETDYEERQRQRRTRERDKAYKQRLANWEGREYRRGKEYEKESKRERERKDEMERERKHLGDFLAEYDDHKDDQKYYKGNAFARRRRDRELEMESDERDRLREKDELEELRLQVIERQAREMLSGDPDREKSGDESPSRAGEEGEEEEGKEKEEEMDIQVKEDLEEDIPLTKSGYPHSVPPPYPPIKVQPAPSVEATTGFQPVNTTEPSPATSALLRTSSAIKNNGEIATAATKEHSEGNSPASPTQTKLAFGLKKAASSNQNQSSLATVVGQSRTSSLDKVFAHEDDEVESKPKKKLVPIEYSDEESEEVDLGRKGDGGGGGGGRSRSRHFSSGSGRSSRRSSSHQGGGGGGGGGSISSLSSSDVLAGLEEMKDRKLSSEERKRVTQTLVNNIPTTKEEVFQYQLKWDQIDKALIEKRVGPWINKKISEYIGEPEPVLMEFICNKLSCHISPSDILNDISMVLDDEAEVFILKLWRLLIYETEAKHLGIAKSYS